MRKLRSTAKLVIAAVTIAALAGLSGCSKSTKPKQVRYNLYISASGYRGPEHSLHFDQFYVYDADSLTLRDSIPLPYMATELEVSPDGRWLYAQCNRQASAPGGLYKIDALTKEIAWSIPEDIGSITLLDDGKLLVLRLQAETDLIDAATGDVISTLPSDVNVLKGPVSGTKVAAVTPDSTPGWYRDTAVAVYDVKSGEVHGLYVPRLASGQALSAIFTARLHPDGKRVMVIGWYAGSAYSWFMVGDVETGKRLLRHRLDRAGGEIAVSEDGALAVASDPGDALTGVAGQQVLFFDLTKMELLKTLAGPVPLPKQVRFLPGDRKMAIAMMVGMGTAPFCIVDRTTLSVENTIQLPDSEPVIGALGVGPRPE